MNVVGIASMRELERRSGVPGPELMRRAGLGAAEAIREEFLLYPCRRRIVVVTGRGNNAGDGIVAALALARESQALPVVIQAAFPPENLTGEAGVFASMLKDSPVEVFERPDFREGDLIVDSLFGIGLSRPIEGVYLDWVRAVNASGCPVVSLDLPSGLNGDTGEVHGEAVRADVTISFGLPKTGLFRGQGPALCGRLRHVMIGIAPEISGSVPAEFSSFYRQDAAGFLPRLQFDAYKNSRGRLLIAAGSPDYPGAPRLTAAAALKTGAGFVRLVTSAPGPFPAPVVLHPGTPEMLERVLFLADAVAAGPGWGTGPEARRMLELILNSHLPAVLDADALNILSEMPGKKLSSRIIMTPHAGEARHLLADLPADRIGAAQSLASKFNCIAVLKGPRTVTALPDGGYCINSSGSPALGIAGAGDVLTGCIGALLAAGLASWDAARLGVWLHGAAGEAVPMRGLSSDELPDRIRRVMGEAAPLS